ncbi:MAG TPA: terminase family protein [Hyphomicrobiaceae bacterium]|nr:terminase family protein [Hyphomicrobiaceae bacterium]
MQRFSQSPEGLDFLAEHLPPATFHYIRNYEWGVIGRDDQLAPVLAKGGGRWQTWLLLGGRGSGKTRAGAEWVRAQVKGEPPLADRRSRRLALVGETIAQVRSIMIEGVSGLMSVYPPAERPTLEASKNRLIWDNGSIAQLFAADDPESLRGPQFDAAWCDELAKWRRPHLAWDNLQFALRLGRWPQCVITTTPRPLPLLKRILDDDATAVTRSRTADNAAFLSPSFLAEMRRRYGDTPIGRQELEGEIVEERMTGLWKRSHIEQGRVVMRPELTRIVVAVDPPVTSTLGSDSCGIIVVGLGVDRRAYVIADRTVQGREPTVWAKAAVAAYHDHEADTIVVETNQGGDLLVQMFRSIDAFVPVKKVYASRGKWVRAEPVSTLYAEGRVVHVGEFPELERQMCDFAADGLSTGKSPDRLDALVWAITELMLVARAAPGVRTTW